MESVYSHWMSSCIRSSMNCIGLLSKHYIVVTISFFALIKKKSLTLCFSNEFSKLNWGSCCAYERQKIKLSIFDRIPVWQVDRTRLTNYTGVRLGTTIFLHHFVHFNGFCSKFCVRITYRTHTEFVCSMFLYRC